MADVGRDGDAVAGVHLDQRLAVVAVALEHRRLAADETEKVIAGARARWIVETRLDDPGHPGGGADDAHRGVLHLAAVQQVGNYAADRGHRTAAGELQEGVDAVRRLHDPRPAAGQRRLVEPVRRRRVIAGGRPVVEPATVQHQVAEAAVGGHLGHLRHQQAAAVGQSEGVRQAGRHGRLRGRTQACRAVGERLVEQIRHAALHARGDVAGNLHVPAAHDRRIGLHGIQATRRIGEPRAVERALQLGTRPRFRIHGSDDFMAHFFNRAGNAPAMVAVRNNGYTHAGTLSEARLPLSRPGSAVRRACP